MPPATSLRIRPSGDADDVAVWRVLEPIIRAGETYALPRDMSATEALRYWRSAQHETFVAEEAGVVVGTYFLRANQWAGGSHVASAGFMTVPAAVRRGVARAMCSHALDHAKSRGFRAMQFNFVVSSNERAVRLWQSLGFEIVGRLPEAFLHPCLGYVDALVMFRRL